MSCYCGKKVSEISVRIKFLIHDSTHFIPDNFQCPSTSGSKRGEHVFNHGLLRFHCDVVKDILRFLEVNENTVFTQLLGKVGSSLTTSDRNSISNMVVYFGPSDNYDNSNAAEFGRAIRELRKNVVEYLKEATRYPFPSNTNRLKTNVRNTVDDMIQRKVYIDSAAKNKWLQEKGNRADIKTAFNNLNNKIESMLRNIVQDFQRVVDVIKEFRKTGHWGSG